VGFSGSGIVGAYRGERALSAGVLAFIPKGALCATVSNSAGFAYPPFAVGEDHCASTTRRGG